MDTPGDREGAGSWGRAGAPSSPSSLALDLKVQRRPGQRALSPRSQAVGPGSGARAERPRGLGLSFAFRVLVIDVAAHGSRVHSCRERPLGGREGGREPEAHTPAHTHPWVRRVFRSRACGSRAGHRAKDRVWVVRRGPQTPSPPPHRGLLRVQAPPSLGPRLPGWTCRMQRCCCTSVGEHAAPGRPPGGSTRRPLPASSSPRGLPALPTDPHPSQPAEPLGPRPPPQIPAPPGPPPTLITPLDLRLAPPVALPTRLGRPRPRTLIAPLGPHPSGPAAPSLGPYPPLSDPRPPEPSEIPLGPRRPPSPSGAARLSPPRARPGSASSHSARNAGTAGASPCPETSPSRLGRRQEDDAEAPGVDLPGWGWVQPLTEVDPLVAARTHVGLPGERGDAGGWERGGVRVRRRPDPTPRPPSPRPPSSSPPLLGPFGGPLALRSSVRATGTSMGPVTWGFSEEGFS